jgi:hypothetical protein
MSKRRLILIHPGLVVFGIEYQHGLAVASV